ncbi:unnamed protein product [Symbiodinium sp. CCMP2592]|nr:unnamed protein product [Symbiodinium sp. CCMP2592]
MSTGPERPLGSAQPEHPVVTPSDIRHPDAEVFVDTLRGDAKKPEFAKVLCANCSSRLQVRLGPVFAGSIEQSLPAQDPLRKEALLQDDHHLPALIQSLEKVVEDSNRARIVTKVEVYKLLTNSKTVAAL